MLRSALSQASKALSSRAFSTRPGLKNVVIVAGVRLPFSMTSTIYKDELAVDLQRLAIQGLLTQTALPKHEVDYVICGNVIQEVRTSNIAREAAINAGLPHTIGAHTIAQVRHGWRLGIDCVAGIYCKLTLSTFSTGLHFIECRHLLCR
jgi:hypothetical protein